MTILDVNVDQHFARSGTPEEAATSFRSDVEELGGPIRLAASMRELGDPRSSEAIMRSIQRMMAGDVRVSGEMQVVVSLIRREEIRAARLYAEAIWAAGPKGQLIAAVEDFTLTIWPARGNRWAATIVYKDGTDAPWPRWENTPEEAKRAAIRSLLDMKIAKDEMWAYANRHPA